MRRERDVKGRRLTIWIWLAGVALLAVIAATLFVYLAWPLQLVGRGESPRRPHMVYGQQLKWRTLVPHTDKPMGTVKPLSGLAGESILLGNCSLTVGNFDADPDDEIVLCLDDRAMLYGLDGTSAKLPSFGDAYDYSVQAWDCNHDGIAELVADPGKYESATVFTANPNCQVGSTQWKQLAPQELPILSLKGTVVAQIPLPDNPGCGAELAVIWTATAGWIT